MFQPDKDVTFCALCFCVRISKVDRRSSHFHHQARPSEEARDDNCTDLFYTFLWTARRQSSWHDVFVAMPLCPAGEEKFNLPQKDWLMVRIHYSFSELVIKPNGTWHPGSKAGWSVCASEKRGKEKRGNS